MTVVTTERSATPPSETGRRRSEVARHVRAGHPEEVLSVASSITGVLAIVCAWMLLQMLFLGNIAEHRSQHLLYSQLRGELAAATAPTGELDYNNKPVAAGSPVAVLSIPVLGVDQVVVDGTSPSDLLRGPGHLRSTPMPGQAGISVVMGRASTYGAPFHEIGALQKGDEINVQDATGNVVYHVVDVRRAGDPIPAAPTGSKAGRLTLVSAQSSGGPLAGLRPRAAVYVDATTAAATPAGVVASGLSSAEEPLGRDTGVLPFLVLLLAILATVVYAIVVARQRFRAVFVWTVASPVVVALAWAVTTQVMSLLPNLM